MKSLFEQYRPTTWSEVVGQDKIVRQIHALAKRGLGGRADWLTGQSGTGKTTIARLLAAELSDVDCTIEIDAGDLTTARVRDFARPPEPPYFRIVGRAILGSIKVLTGR